MSAIKYVRFDSPNGDRTVTRCLGIVVSETKNHQTAGGTGLILGIQYWKNDTDQFIMLDSSEIEPVELSPPTRTAIELDPDAR